MDNESKLVDPSPSAPLLGQSALIGLAGDFVSSVAPYSESDLSSLLSQFLSVFGAAIGPSAHFMVEGAEHAARLYVLLVGATSSARKGTSLRHVDRLFRLAVPEWYAEARLSGLTTGEGLISHLKDTAYAGKPARAKNVVVFEAEFARTIAACSRRASTLGAVMREARDGCEFRVMTRAEPIVATGAHVSIIGHITSEELHAKLPKLETANGFLNRFLTVYAARRQKLPFGGNMPENQLESLAHRLSDAIAHGRLRNRVKRSKEASDAWSAFYQALPDVSVLVRDVTARAAPQVLRLSLIYALLDKSNLIEVRHQFAAEALWKYCESTANLIYGNSKMNDETDRIYRAL